MTRRTGPRPLLQNIRSLFLYFVVPVLGAAAPLAVIPAVTSRFGADGWAATAIALGIGNAGLIFAEVGWGMVGPQRVTRSTASRPAVYESAFASKLVATAVIAPTCGVIAATVSPGHQLATALIAAGSVAGALTPSWYFVGVGRPGLVLLCETIPRVLLLALAAVLVLVGADLVVYGIALLLAIGLALALAARAGGLPFVPSRAAFRSVPSTLRAHATLAAGRCVSTLYTSLPAVFLGLVSPTDVASFSAADRPMRMGFVVLGAVPARLQSWIGTPDRTLGRARSRRSLLINALLGVTAGGAFLVGMPLVAPVLFTGAVAVEPLLVALGAAVVLIMCTSRGFVLALVAADRARDVTPSVIVAAIVGVPAIVLGGVLFGAPGAMAGVLVAELFGLALQSAHLARAWRRVPA